MPHWQMWTSRKNLPRTNTLAYLASFSATKKTSFRTTRPERWRQWPSRLPGAKLAYAVRWNYFQGRLGGGRTRWWCRRRGRRWLMTSRWRCRAIGNTFKKFHDNCVWKSQPYHPLPLLTSLLTYLAFKWIYSRSEWRYLVVKLPKIWPRE